MKPFSGQDLQVQYSNNSEIHLATGGSYCLQLRTQPDGVKFRGSWSAWSEFECIEVPPGAGKRLHWEQKCRTA